MTTATSCIRLAVALAVATAALAPRSVCAQSADAEALFLEGKRLWNKGKSAQACDKFEASERIDPAPGTEVNLARCREKNHRLASAWALYRTAAATFKHRGDKAREVAARKQADKIEPDLVYLTIAVPENARVDGLVIQRNGTAVDAAIWNQRVPVDPDEYTISAEAPGHRPWSKSVVVETRSEKLEVPPLQKRPAPPAEPRREVRSAAAGADEPSGARDRGMGAEAGSAPSRWTGKRKLSIALAAVGVAAAGAAIGLGIHANQLESQSDAICSDPTCHSREAVDLNGSARHYAFAANIGYVAGGTAVVGAALLWFLGGPRSSSAEPVAVIPSFGAGRVGVVLARSF